MNSRRVYRNVFFFFFFLNSSSTHVFAHSFATSVSLTDPINTMDNINNEKQNIAIGNTGSNKKTVLLSNCQSEEEKDDKKYLFKIPSSKNCEQPDNTDKYCNCIMVTGGVGFVGSHIAETLLREGRKVIVYDLFNSETTKSTEKLQNAEVLNVTATKYQHIGASVTIVQGDIRDQECIIKTIQQYSITSCIHVGGMVDDRRSVIHPEEYIDVNIRGTALLLDALGKCGVKMVVQASTRSVFGQRDDNDIMLDEKADRRPINPYGASKVGADAMAHCYSHLYKMNVTLVRIFATYGPRGRPDMIPRILIENIVNDKEICKFGNGTATRTWIYVSDIVSAFLLALKNPPSQQQQDGSYYYAEYNTGAPNSTTLNELIACAETVTGKKAIIKHCPVPPGDAHTVGHPNYEKIHKELGWIPKVNVLEGMRLVYNDYINQKMKKNEQQGKTFSQLDDMNVIIDETKLCTIKGK